MRLFVRHFIIALVGFFALRLLVQASNHHNPVELPKAVLLSRLSDGAPIPRGFEKEKILKAILKESEGLVDRKPGARNR
jgi:hypothetical protein